MRAGIGTGFYLGFSWLLSSFMHTYYTGLLFNMSPFVNVFCHLQGLVLASTWVTAGCRHSSGIPDSFLLVVENVTLLYVCVCVLRAGIGAGFYLGYSWLPSFFRDTLFISTCC
jgi:hypothetical protein